MIHLQNGLFTANTSFSNIKVVARKSIMKLTLRGVLGRSNRQRLFHLHRKKGSVRPQGKRNR